MAAPHPRLAARVAALAGARLPALSVAVLLAAPAASLAQTQPESVEATVQRARELASSGQAGSAVDLLLEGGSARLLRGEDRAAEDLMQVASELAPTSAAVHSLHGRAQLSLRRFRLAASSLERARQLGDGSLRTTLYLAAARWENGDLAGSEELYREAIARTGGAPLPLHQLGRLLLWQGRYEDALVPLRQAASRTPELDVRLDLARALDRAGLAEEAIAAYRRVVEAEPEHPRAHYGLGRALARLGRREEAARHLAIHERVYLEDQQRTREAGLLDVALDAARIEAEGGHPGAARSRLARLPETPDVLAARAAAHRRAGDLRSALADLERAVGAAPEREDLQALLRDARLAGLDPR